MAVLVGVALLPLYDIITSSERGSHSSVNRIKATNFAADLLEQLKAVPYDQLPVLEENGEIGWPDNQVGNHMVQTQAGVELYDLGAKITPVTTGGDFERYLAIKEVSSRAEQGSWGGLKRILVTVRWKEVMSGKKNDSELRMAYLVSREGVNQ